jgi:hypothetical protein
MVTDGGIEREIGRGGESEGETERERGNDFSLS